MMFKFLDRFFGITESWSNIKTEILAWIATFLSLSYIFIVNPSILSQTWMSIESVTLATIIGSWLATLFMWLRARLPFALAPWLEMNWFFALIVVGMLWFTRQQWLWLVFRSGLLCILFTVIPFRKKIIDAIPDGLKAAISFSVWVFVCIIGLFLAWILSFENGLIASVWSFISTKAIVLYIGLAVAVFLDHKLIKNKIPWWMLIAIVVATWYATTHGISAPWFTKTLSLNGTLGKLDLLWLFQNIRFLPSLLVFFLIDFYGSIWKFIWLTSAVPSLKEKTNINIAKAMYVDGYATIGWSLLWTSSLITYVESAVWIGMWWRTWLTAVICGLLMLCCVVFTPLISLIPVEATSWILVYVGYLLLPKNFKSSDSKYFDIVVAIALGVVTAITFWLDKKHYFLKYI